MRTTHNYIIIRGAGDVGESMRDERDPERLVAAQQPEQRTGSRAQGSSRILALICWAARG